jgi:hypothetical protein
MKKYRAIAAAGGALAIGVPAAFAATDATTVQDQPVQNATPTPTPDTQAPRDDRRGPGGREDCPEHDGQGSGSTAAPTTPDASTL